MPAPQRQSASLTAFLSPLVLLVFPVAASYLRVVEDTPGRLVVEIACRDLRLESLEGGVRPACTGCVNDLRPGAPDLPVDRFQIIADGRNSPGVSMQILESEARQVPEGLRPVPHAVTPRELSFEPSADLYARAADWRARVADPRLLRGAPVRHVEVPLALWDDKKKELVFLKRIRVTFTFPSPHSGSYSAPLGEPLASDVLNPMGGRQLFSPRSKPLRKASRPASLGERFLRIRVGDKDVESLGEDRVYELGFAAFSSVLPAEESSGIPTASLRLYTGPADTLKAHFDTLAPSPGLLRQVPLEVLDRNGNSTFDQGDAVRFFGRGASRWKRLDSLRGPVHFEFEVNPYSFDNFYFLSYSGGDDKALRLERRELPAASDPLASSYIYLRAEKEVETAQCDPSGHWDTETNKEWFWHWKGSCKGSNDTVLYGNQLFSPQVQSLAGYAGDSLLLGFYTYPKQRGDDFKAHIGGHSPYYLNHPGVNGSFYVLRELQGAGEFRLDSLEWKGGANRLEGYTVSYRRRHMRSEGPFRIFPSTYGRRVSYRLDNPQGLRVLKLLQGEAEAELEAQGGLFTDSLGTGDDGLYYVFREEDILALKKEDLAPDALPASGTAIRDLATGDGENPEYIIIAPDALLTQALKLRDYRNEPSRAMPLRTAVVRVGDVYRHYSGGRMSPVAIRDFLRWAMSEWHSGGASSSPLRYVLLFGDGHYDYRSIKAGAGTNEVKPNLIPPFEYYTSSSSYGGMTSDDFYVSLTDGRFDSNSPLDIAVGRLPFASVREAGAYLEKVKRYEDPADAGEWRSRVVLAADDGMQKNEIDPITVGHTNDTEALGDIILSNEPGITLEKVYLVDYEPNSAWQKPDAAQDLLALINRGAVMVNYVGHGSSDVWADEGLMRSREALARLENRGRYTLLNSFSCTVGRFDLLSSDGLSEKFVRAEGVGAIGAISATRESYPTQNIALAKAVYDRLFPPESATAPVTVGEAMRGGKNEVASSNYNDQKYGLLGEPVLLIRKPKLKVSLSRYPDTLQALDCGAMEGRVEGGSGRGMVNVKILGGEILKEYPQPGNIHLQKAKKRGSILFEGSGPYDKGRFSLEYLIPKRIPYGDTTAQILAFAWDSQAEKEGSAAVFNLSVKGTAEEGCKEADDGKGPSIVVTGCDLRQSAGEDFPDEVALPLPYCLEIQVRDSLGGVATGEGPDEGTTIEIPGSLEPFHPIARIDELRFKSYKLTLEEKSVRPGRHLLKLSARDGYGNYSERQMRLNLRLDSALSLVKAYNVPNPLKKGSTTFYFSTVIYADAGEIFQEPTTGDMRYEIRLFNQQGHLVKVLNDARSGETTWDGRDNWGNRLGNGVYFYEVTARESLNDFNFQRRRKSSKRNILLISR